MLVGGAAFGAGCLGGVGFGLLVGAEAAAGRTGAPHLGVVKGLELFAELFFVVRRAAGLDDVAGFALALDFIVELGEDGQRGFLEAGFPIERTALGGCGAVGVHPVHAVFVYQADEALGEFFNGFVEGFGRAVAVLAEHVVLGFHHACQAAHQHAALADEVGGHFVFEAGGEEVTGTDRDTDGEGAVHCLGRCVLRNREAGVDAHAIEEVAAHGCARTLGGDHDDVDVSGHFHAGELAVNPTEAVREVEGFAGGHVRGDGGPHALDGGVVQEDHDDAGAFASFVDAEEGLADFEAIFLCALPVCSKGFVLADDNIDAVVAHVQSLGGALDAVADDGDGLTFEDLLRLLQGIFFTSDDGLNGTAKVDLSHNY